MKNYLQLFPDYRGDNLASYCKLILSLADAVHLSAARWTYTLCCRFAVLHGDLLRVLHLFFGAALHTICLHFANLLALGAGYIVFPRLSSYLRFKSSIAG